MGRRTVPMTRHQRETLTQFLASFVEAHPGTRRGQLFGRPAAFAGVKAFAKITDRGLACRVPVSTARENNFYGPGSLPNAGQGWIVIPAEQIGLGGAVVRLEMLLEHAVANVLSRLRPAR